ncbi:hypothetical protein [Candidatus Tisiphia endosymbiont of Ditula angustiorana]|uniref:hypothetical protein n=1 Tax=Candidatus Tisiphia endosymbiont of Ditula angustiorana TaxID=3066272 RepID=UPI00312C906B
MRTIVDIPDKQIEILDQLSKRKKVSRAENRVKIPDAIIWATTQYNNGLLITRNIKDFPNRSSDIEIPYYI